MNKGRIGGAEEDRTPDLRIANSSFTLVGCCWSRFSYVPNQSPSYMNVLTLVKDRTRAFIHPQLQWLYVF